jgi:hypothetical protein
MRKLYRDNNEEKRDDKMMQGGDPYIGFSHSARQIAPHPLECRSGGANGRVWKRRVEHGDAQAASKVLLLGRRW